MSTVYTDQKLHSTICCTYFPPLEKQSPTKLSEVAKICCGLFVMTVSLIWCTFFSAADDEDEDEDEAAGAESEDEETFHSGKCSWAKFM